MPTDDRQTQPIPTAVTVTLTADQRRRWTAAADFDGLTLEAWLVAAADRVCRDFELGPLDAA